MFFLKLKSKKEQEEKLQQEVVKKEKEKEKEKEKDEEEEKRQHLIYLFTYSCEQDDENYINTIREAYIDDRNGDLYLKSYVNRDPFSMRLGALSVYEHRATYEDYNQLFNSYTFDDQEKFKELNQDNWKEWLIKHNYINSTGA